MHRHAAHGYVLALMLAALGQRDAERAARHLRVVKEELVEIPHSIEQQAAGIGGLDLEVLLHHRRDAAAFTDARRRILARGRLIRLVLEAARKGLWNCHATDKINGSFKGSKVHALFLRGNQGLSPLRSIRADISLRPRLVITSLVPQGKAWMAGTGPAMTNSAP